jgi:hypothetical protein
VRASDIPAFLSAGLVKEDAMRWVHFPLRDRLEMTTVMVALYGLILAILSVLLRPSLAPRVIGVMMALSYVYGMLHPWIPGRDGLGKGAALALATVFGLWVWSAGWGHLGVADLVSWSLGLGFLAFFVGAEYQGMSPRMRGEQANWTILGAVGVVVLVAYGLIRLLG